MIVVVVAVEDVLGTCRLAFVVLNMSSYGR